MITVPSVSKYSNDGKLNPAGTAVTGLNVPVELSAGQAPNTTAKNTTIVPGRDAFGAASIFRGKLLSMEHRTCDFRARLPAVPSGARENSLLLSPFAGTGVSLGGSLPSA